MKRIVLGIGLVLTTASLVVGAAWFVRHASRSGAISVTAPVASETIQPALETLPVKLAEAITIELRRSHKNKNGLVVAEFRVTNNGAEPLEYGGDASTPNWNRYYSVKSDTELEESDRRCGTGLAFYALRPGKSAKFEVVAEKAGSAKVGFDFFVGKERSKRSIRTFWSDEVYLSE